MTLNIIKQIEHKASYKKCFIVTLHNRLGPSKVGHPEAFPAGHARLCHWHFFSARGRLVDPDPLEGAMAGRFDMLSWAMEHFSGFESLATLLCIWLFYLPWTIRMFFDLMYKIRNDNDSGKGFIHGFNQEKGWLSNMNCSTKPANMGTITG